MRSLNQRRKDRNFNLICGIVLIINSLVIATGVIRNCTKRESPLERTESRQTTVYTKNDRWGPEPETFYDEPQGIGYIRIDRVPTKDYVRNPREESQ